MNISSVIVLQYLALFVKSDSKMRLCSEIVYIKCMSSQTITLSSEQWLSNMFTYY